ncbi:helix-turn-helix transcriptional regulator [Mycolicibacterium fortuitum]|uniref:XRE family transcriptional regulator n=1 Tax=Mycolicibacterium fortuitum TaxID=1766 RepID=UPI0034D0151F
MAGKKSDLGPIGKNVARTTKRFRELRRLSYAELSRQLAELGREIPPLGLRRIESEDRKVDVDDLFALALTLEVSPLALLLPVEDSALTPQGMPYDVDKIWNWAAGSQALSEENAFRFIRDSNPLIDWTDVEPRLAQEATVMLKRKQEPTSGND